MNFLILVAFFALYFFCIHAALLFDQWEALMNVYDAAGCPTNSVSCPRFNASEPCPPDGRTGVDVRLNCNASHVLHINFATELLNGILTSQIGRLTGLTRLDIYDNRNLRGRIPDTIRQLSKLTFLAIASNRQIIGSIPDLSTLTDATDIHLWGNHLEGTISSTFASLSALKVLLLHNNEFLYGTIPQEFSKPAGKWTDFLVHVNRLTGDVPALPTIGNCIVSAFTDNLEKNCFDNCQAIVGQYCNCGVNTALYPRCATTTTTTTTTTAAPTTPTTTTASDETTTTTTTNSAIASTTTTTTTTTSSPPTTTTTTTSSEITTAQNVIIMVEVLPSWVLPVVIVLAVIAVFALVAAVVTAMISRRVTSQNEPYLPRSDDAHAQDAVEMNDVDDSHSGGGGENGERASSASSIGTTSSASKPVPARHLVKK